MTKQNHELGILLSFAGYSAWVAGDTFVKLAGETLRITQILTINFFVGMLFLLVIVGLNGGYKQLASKRPWYQLLCSILVMGASFGSIAGVIYLSLADFYTIIFTSPLIMAILGRFFLKEKTDRAIWLAIIFGFLGVIVAVRFANTSSHEFSWIGIAVTCLASLAMSLSMIVVRAAPGENNYALSFWPRVINFIASVILLLWVGDVTNWSAIGLLYAVLSGIMGGVGVLLTNLSLRYAPIAIVSPYHYTQIIGGALIGYLVWHHIPAPSVAVGAIMITASGLFILRHQQLAARMQPLAGDESSHGNS